MDNAIENAGIVVLLIAYAPALIALPAGGVWAFLAIALSTLALFTSPLAFVGVIPWLGRPLASMVALGVNVRDAQPWHQRCDNSIRSSPTRYLVKTQVSPRRLNCSARPRPI